MNYRGPVVGDLMGKPIFQSMDYYGTVYEFDRIAECHDDELGVQNLKSTEIFVLPGLIYRRTS